MSDPERFISVASAADRADASAFLSRALRTDDSAVVRLHTRSDGLIGLWANSGFDVLVTRSVFGRLRPGDIVCDATTLRTGLASLEPNTPLDPGFSLDSAWRGALPPDTGYVHLDDVPARTVVELSRNGAHLARTQGSAHGPASGLLDQDVLELSGIDGDPIGVSLRSLFALTAMGFIRDQHGREITENSAVDDIAETEPVRIRLSGPWIRIDARYGSVYRRRGRSLDLTAL